MPRNICRLANEGKMFNVDSSQKYYSKWVNEMTQWVKSLAPNSVYLSVMAGTLIMGKGLLRVIS